MTVGDIVLYSRMILRKTVTESQLPNRSLRPSQKKLLWPNQSPIVKTSLASSYVACSCIQNNNYTETTHKRPQQEPQQAIKVSL
jgi:hypothetical protein